MYNTQSFDAFLSYNSADRLIIEFIAQKLKDKGLNIFFDRWYLVPGAPWPQHLENVLNSCSSVVVFLGAGGMGTWQLREQQLALDHQTKKEEFHVIPVILPGADPPLGFLSLNTWIDFRQGTINDDYLSILESAIRGLPVEFRLQKKFTDTAAVISPYRGLRYFREEDAPFFFGRETFINKLEIAVRQHPIIAVIGASGSGKSSVVRAGLIPRLRRLKDNDTWDIITMLPGDQPFKNLAISLLPLLEPEMTEVDRLTEIKKLSDGFISNQVNLRDVVQRALEKQPGTNKLMVIVDQWEEIYAPAFDQFVRQKFIDELLDGTTGEKLCVVLTLRADFYDKVLDYRRFSDKLQDGVVSIGQMNKEELKAVIEEPAKKVGLWFEAGLVDRILEKVEGQPGNLPLLEFVLMELWKEKEGSILTHSLYKTIGEVDGAIAKHAESVFNSFSKEEKDITKRIFLQLIHPGFSTEQGKVDPTRRRTLFNEFDKISIPVIKKLADGHLIVTGRNDATGEETVDLVHEALIKGWGTLQQWIDEDKKFLYWREQLRSLITIAKLSHNTEKFVLNGELLREAKSWLNQRPLDLSISEQNFIKASVKDKTKKTKLAILVLLSIVISSTIFFPFKKDIIRNLSHVKNYNDTSDHVLDEINDSSQSKKPDTNSKKAIIRKPEAYIQSIDYTEDSILEHLRKGMGASPHNQLLLPFAQSLNKYGKKYGIDSRLRLAAFIAQVGHETAGLFYMQDLSSGEEFEGRKDLGNIIPGDGRKYKGRGLIAIAGRHYYQLLTDSLGVDLINKPELLATNMDVMMQAALWFWNLKNLNEIADQIDINKPINDDYNFDYFEQMTKKINGGTNGLSDRYARYKLSLKEFGLNPIESSK